MYLYGARYNLKTETTYEKSSDIFGMTKGNLATYKSRKTKIKNNYYLIDDDTPVVLLKELYSKVEYENEVWKIIEGSDDKFLVSNYGRFKRVYNSSPDGKFIMPYFIKRCNSNNRNKQFIKVKFNGKYKEHNVARIVVYHFVDIY